MTTLMAAGYATGETGRLHFVTSQQHEDQRAGVAS